MLLWETAIPVPLLTLLHFHGQAAIPSNTSPSRTDPNPDWMNLYLCHFRDAMRRPSLPSQSNLVDPTMHLRHSNPMENLSGNHTDQTRQILHPLYSLYARQHLPTHHLIWGLQSPAKKQTRNRYINTADQSLCFRPRLGRGPFTATDAKTDSTLHRNPDQPGGPP